MRAATGAMVGVSLARMAQRVVTQLIDDLSGKEIPDGGGETVQFSLDGTNYEIDLSTKNSSKLRSVIAEYTQHARKVGPARGRSRAKTSGSASAAEIKAWARSNGYEVADRGRVPNSVREAYEARR